MKIIDHTLTVSEKIPTFPGSPKPHFIEWETIAKDGYNLELLFLSSHTGTHIDAPFHFVKNGKKIAGLRAGGHFDPERSGHNSHHNHSNKHDKDMKPHGDLPELIADVNGNATTSVMTNKLQVSQLIGRSIMIHQYGENEIGKPKGGGARIACGVIEIK